jgi:hypothetical protein
MRSSLFGVRPESEDALPTGFIYVVNTVNSKYEQPALSCVPTMWQGRLYFGPCKVPMRPRMKPDDWIFGVSPSATKPRRIVFSAEIEKVMTFADAYRRFSALRGPLGPIPVEPAKRLDPGYARSHYAPITGSAHDDRWELDVATPELDRFFVCRPPDGFRNAWLGAAGPVVDAEILGFFNRCPVFGQSADGTQLNTGRPTAPIALGGLCKGLHLETDVPERLLAMCEKRVEGSFQPASDRQPRLDSRQSGGCGKSQVTVARRASRRC